MIILSGIVLGRRRNLGHDGSFEWPAFIQRRFGHIGGFFLRIIVIKNATAILRPDVAKLLVFYGRINVVPEHIE